MHLAQPLLIADLSGSLARAAFFAAFGTAVHLVGTYLAGWPTDRFGARRVLVTATLLRGVVLAISLLRWPSANRPHLGHGLLPRAEALILGFTSTPRCIPSRSNWPGTGGPAGSHQLSVSWHSRWVLAL